jgi:pyruvate/2-oxoglutarate dehydrogenase complex dihydrolipoamide dehydrogenase (E3) component
MTEHYRLAVSREGLAGYVAALRAAQLGVRSTIDRGVG